MSSREKKVLKKKRQSVYIDPNCQGHPRSVFEKYHFGRRFEI